MGPITDSERTSLIQNSSLYMKYENKVDDVSAFEKINEHNEKLAEEQKQIEEQKAKEKEEKEKAKEEKEAKKKKSGLEKMGSRLANKTIDRIGRKIGDAIFKGLFK